jgi:hypothetical protein
MRGMKIEKEGNDGRILVNYKIFLGFFTICIQGKSMTPQAGPILTPWSFFKNKLVDTH